MIQQKEIYLTMEQLYEAKKVRQWAADQRMLRVAKGKDSITAQSLLDGCDQ